MVVNKTFSELCAHTHDLVSRYINQLIDMNVDVNPATQQLLNERMKAFEFISNLRLDFQPVFVTPNDLENLWESIRTVSVVQELMTTVTLKLLVHVAGNFTSTVATQMKASVEVMVATQGALDADYHERIVEPDELYKLILNNPWFATVLLIALGRDEYVKPEFNTAV